MMARTGKGRDEGQADHDVRGDPGGRRREQQGGLQGPKGNARVVNVSDPEMQAKLPSLKPGQVVQFTYTEAVAVAIQPKK